MVKKIVLPLLCALGVLLIIYALNYCIIVPYSEAWYSRLNAVSTGVAAIFSIGAVIFAFRSFTASRDMLIETQKQNDPAITVKIIPDKDQPNLLNVWIKNTGGGPAYDIHIGFEPDLLYRDTTINKLKLLNNISLLERGEEIEFYFDSAIDYLNSEKIQESKVTLEYYRCPKGDNKKQNSIIRKYNIKIDERKGLRFASKKNLNDLVLEIEELKQALLIILAKK
jgi:hypothetical protein